MLGIDVDGRPRADRTAEDHGLLVGTVEVNGVGRYDHEGAGGESLQPRAVFDLTIYSVPLATKTRASRLWACGGSRKRAGMAKA